MTIEIIHDKSQQKYMYVAGRVEPVTWSEEQSDLGLYCLPGAVCPKTWNHCSS